MSNQECVTSRTGIPACPCLPKPNQRRIGIPACRSVNRLIQEKSNSMARIPLSRECRTGIFNLLMIILCSPFLSIAQSLPSWNIPVVSETRVSGDYRDVVVVDTIAYFSNQWGLVLFDASNPRTHL